MQPYKAVSVGTDFSPSSAGALAQAIRIAAWSGGTPVAVHVLDKQVIENVQFLAGARVPITEALTDHAVKSWSAFTGSVPGAAGLPLKVIVDDRAAGLVGHAKAGGCDLLVLGCPAGAPYEAGVGMMTLSSARHAPCDVLVARESARGPFRTVVACTDFSDASRRALERAADVAGRDGAALRVLHVYTEPTRLYPTLSVVVRAWIDAVLDYQKIMQNRLEAFIAGALPDAPGVKPTAHVVDSVGHGRAIAAFAQESKADLIVVATRGRTNLHDLLLGSTAERVLRDSSCSVLAVRPAGAA